MFDSPEPLFLRDGQQLAIGKEARRRIAMVCVKAENCHCMTVIRYRLSGVDLEIDIEFSMLDTRFSIHKPRCPVVSGLVFLSPFTDHYSRLRNSLLPTQYWQFRPVAPNQPR